MIQLWQSVSSDEKQKQIEADKKKAEELANNPDDPDNPIS